MAAGRPAAAETFNLFTVPPKPSIAIFEHRVDVLDKPSACNGHDLAYQFGKAGGAFAEPQSILPILINDLDVVGTDFVAGLQVRDEMLVCKRIEAAARGAEPERPVMILCDRCHCQLRQPCRDVI